MKKTSHRHLFGQVIDRAETAHAVLGVERGASGSEVREAYIRLVKKFHPDMNSGDLAAERRFKRVNQAYEELKSGYPARHREPGAFPRRRQHWHRAIVIATAAALFAVSPALVLTLAAWKTVPVMAAQPRIEPATVTPLPAIGASEAVRREARLFEGQGSAASPAAAWLAPKPPTGDALPGSPIASLIQTYPAAQQLDKARARIDFSSRPEGRHTPHAALAGKVLRQARLTKRRCCGRQGSSGRKLRTSGFFLGDARKERRIQGRQTGVLDHTR